MILGRHSVEAQGRAACGVSHWSDSLSRSQLYTAAVIEYVKKRQDRRITAKLNSIYFE
jgi:hypothetical protein